MSDGEGHDGRGAKVAEPGALPGGTATPVPTADTLPPIPPVPTADTLPPIPPRADTLPPAAPPPDELASPGDTERVATGSGEGPAAETPADGASETPPEPIPPERDGGDTPRPEERIAALEVEKKGIWDRLLRTAADLDNLRKRTRRDIVDALERGRDEVLHEILPVADNIERAIAHGGQPGAEAGALVEGVRMVQRQLLAALERFDVRPFDSVGKPFDPERHEALSQIETDDAPPGTVVTELQRGYTHGARVARPALVVVARTRGKTPPPAPKGGNGAGGGGAGGGGADDVVPDKATIEEKSDGGAA